MSTTGIESWAVDLKDVGAIYPMQGAEGVLVVIGLLTWIAWHIWCTRWEQKSHQDQIDKFGNEESLRQALEDD